MRREKEGYKKDREIKKKKEEYKEREKWSK